MKQKFTNYAKLALCALGLGAATRAQAAYVPVALTGYNHDVVANGTGVSTNSTTVGVDDSNYVFMAQDYNPTGTSYLPNNGLINSAATAGLAYQLAPYTGSNSLRMPATATGTGTGSGTLTFTTPQSAGEVYVLATSGSGASTATITVTFTDGTTQVFSGQTVSDWYGGSGYAILGLGRVQRGVENRENNASDPRLYQLRLTIASTNFAKQIQSVGFAKTSTTGVLNVMGITINSVCSGTPAAGVPAASTASACTNNSFTLSLTGAASGSGISYQWQSSPAGANAFANIAGATTVPYTVASQTAATDYRVVVTCSGSGISSTSPLVNVPQNSFLNCYCTPTGGSCANEWIRGVTLASLGNTGTTCSSGGYASYTTNAALTTTLSQGATYPVTLDLRVNATNSAAGIWIDYDHSGTFDASEYTLVGTGPATGFATLDLSLTANVTIPATALTGPTRLRVRSNNGGVVGNQACFNNYFGEVEDYVVTIAAPTACAGTPSGGTATASSPAVCPATAFTLRASGYSTGATGLTYQWQSSPAGANTFTNIAGATTVPYTVASLTAATDYRLQVTCAAGSATALSAPVSVTLAPFTQCYCTPTYVSGGNTDIIKTVTLRNLANNTSTLGNVAPYYHDYSAQQTGASGLAVPEVVVGFQNNVVLTFGAEPSQYSALWIDFNHNGIFDGSEYFTSGTNAGANGTATINVVVPTGALLGQTKMRIRGGDDSVPLATQACGASQSDYGEAEDYLVNIAIVTASRTGQPEVALNAFPNPATNSLAVTVATAGPRAQLSLTDLTGRALQTQPVTSQTARFDLSSLPAGIYLVRYQDDSRISTIKVSKQ
ncbi:GEVED domain-containing protein [Hymenobacter convexus]|uniref:GEVED domain-containing protein n=1 Tax=Hymenobacter sp. CA1UV-4 TaxID=3063782 RepID=UPI002712B7A0|nr:GEVED domain-containing protein [Hymenobacter sp. CA1UV-4]MDO7853103.1 GEVED domain-containing protein [Hymenobacter sp. CA1UV-4]